MNAENFYEHFKDALKYLGLLWGEMDQAVVSIVDGKFTLTNEEIWELAANCLDSVAGRMQFARAIESAHGIKG